ncbi:hypothetical protein NUW58_g1561 [Xylaria curta]|uniref:Uncharacterized protein n=1 Tax=Xylaria curta TaxID=42375 RepID=A0ACC1PJM9_9PEZI|nr:hypothetical protein NUW58_g1561 [Xylaria curta]
MDAFSHSEYTYWWGPISAIWSWQQERVRQRFTDPNTQQFKIVDDGNGTIVAWAKWETPPRLTGLKEGHIVYDDAGEPINIDADSKNGEETGAFGGKEADIKTTAKSYALCPPEGSNAALFQTFFAGLVSMGKKYQASEKLGNYYKRAEVLTHLCTRHSYHGRGLGSALLRCVLDVADRENVPAYLEASRAGLSLYKKTGYEVVDMLEFDRAAAGFDTPATLQYHHDQGAMRDVNYASVDLHEWSIRTAPKGTEQLAG